MNRADRRKTAKHPGAVEKMLDAAWENGFQAGKNFACKMLCAAVSLALSQLHGLETAEILSVYHNAVQRIFEADCPEMLLEQCEKDCGVAPGMFDFDRATEMEDEEQTP